MTFQNPINRFETLFATGVSVIVKRIRGFTPAPHRERPSSTRSSHFGKGLFPAYAGKRCVQSNAASSKPHCVRPWSPEVKHGCLFITPDTQSLAVPSTSLNPKKRSKFSLDESQGGQDHGPRRLKRSFVDAITMCAGSTLRASHTAAAAQCLLIVSFRQLTLPGGSIHNVPLFLKRVALLLALILSLPRSMPADYTYQARKPPR